MSDYRIRLACGYYDRTSAIVHGLVRPSGVDLEVVAMNDTARMFSGMFRGEYDASEMSLAELVYYASRGKNDFIGIPVFPSRVFRHGFIFYNALSNIHSPQDLEGKKIGFSCLVQTASVWIRGILVDEFNLSPRRTSLHVAVVHRWHDGTSSNDLKTRDGSVIRVLEKRGKNETETAGLALQEGLIDVLGTTRTPSFFGKDKRVKRLFEDYRSAEISYFQKTRIFPIMHVLVARKSVIEKHPDLPEKLFDLFAKAKKWTHEWIKNPSSLSIVWKGPTIEEEQRIFDGDPWVYGLEKNAHGIDKFLSYCYDLGISEQRINPKDLFAPSTWALREEPRDLEFAAAPTEQH